VLGLFDGGSAGLTPFYQQPRLGAVASIDQPSPTLPCAPDSAP
jgi:hypothetical protein